MELEMNSMSYAGDREDGECKSSGARFAEIKEIFPATVPRGKPSREQSYLDINTANLGQENPRVLHLKVEKSSATGLLASEDGQEVLPQEVDGKREEQPSTIGKKRKEPSGGQDSLERETPKSKKPRRSRRSLEDALACQMRDTPQVPEYVFRILRVLRHERFFSRVNHFLKRTK